MKKVFGLILALVFTGAVMAQPEATPGSDAMAAFIAEAAPQGWLQIAPVDALDQIDAISPYILDVRNQAEWDDNGYIEGAVLIPLAELDARKAELPADLNTPMLVYCAVGIRGNFGLTYLKLLGYTNVRNIRGGFNAWVAEGLPVAN